MPSKAKSTSKSTSTEAASGVDARRTTSDAERDQTTSRLDQITDVGADEATQAAIIDQTRSWNANVKRTYDRVEEEMSSSVKSAQDHLNSVRAIREQMLTNMVVNCDALQKQHTAHRDIATDRTWTQVNELETMLAAKSGVQADAMVTLLAKAVADALGTKK